MNKFKKMIQTAKLGHLYSMEGEHLPDAMDSFVAASEKNEVFVFEEPNKDSDDVREIYWGSVPVDSPFEIFSIEFENDFNICGSLPNQKQYLTQCIMVQELELDESYRFYVLVLDESKNSYFVAVTENKDYYTPLIKNLLEKLNKSYCGIETVREAVTIRKGKKKYPIKKNRQFIVCGSSRRKKYEKGKSAIEWNHKTSVRGHWRRQFCNTCKGSGCGECDGLGLRKGFLGLDRKGNRVVKGKTWIQHHGDSIVKKIRKVAT